MKNIFNPQRLARLWFKARQPWVIWYYLLNSKNRRLYKKEKSELDKVQKRVAEDFKRDGIAVTSLDELFPGRNLFPELKSFMEKDLVNAKVKTYKEFIRNLWDVHPTVDFENPFFKLALENKILGIVNEYMQMCAKFYYMTLNVTTPVEKDSIPVQSQRWHRDPEDKKMCKIFLYMTDVDDKSGPFIYTLNSQFGGKYGHLFPQNPPRGNLPQEEEINRLIPKHKIKPFIGKVGTLIFCDTVGIHRGGYSEEKQRIMFTAGYCSQASAWPERYKLSDNFKVTPQYGLLNPIQKYALTYKPGTISTYFFKKIKKNVIY